MRPLFVIGYFIVGSSILSATIYGIASYYFRDLAGKIAEGRVPVDGGSKKDEDKGTVDSGAGKGDAADDGTDKDKDKDATSAPVSTMPVAPLENSPMFMPSRSTLL